MFFLATVCISIAITIIISIKTKSKWSENITPSKARSTILNEAFYMFAAIFSQGSPQTVAPILVRILHASYWIFLVTMVVAYTSQLVALIAVTKISLPINSFRELADSPSYKVSIATGTGLFDFLRYANEEALRKVWRQKIQKNSGRFFSPSLEGYLSEVPSIRTSDRVILGSKHRLETLISHLDNCDVAIVEDHIFAGYMTFAAYKGFPLVNAFNNR